jgi:hypothetical protein
VLDFESAITSGDGVGALNIGSLGTLEFDAAVDASHRVHFGVAGGTLELGDAGDFHGKVPNFVEIAAADGPDQQGGGSLEEDERPPLTSHTPTKSMSGTIGYAWRMLLPPCPSDVKVKLDRCRCVGSGLPARRPRKGDGDRCKFPAKESSAIVPPEPFTVRIPDVVDPE